MKGLKKLSLLVVAFSVVAFLLAGCSGGQVKIGVAAPLTGEQANGGNAVLNGARLAVDDWNAKGGVFGKKIILIAKDDMGDPDQAVMVAKELSKKVDVVIGHYNSNCTLAAEPIYARENMVMITPSSTNPAVTDSGYLTIFRVCGRDDQQGKRAAEYVANHFPEAKVAVINDNSTYGQDLVNEFLKNYEFLTKRESVLYSSIQRTGVDIPAVVEGLKKAEPTIVYFGGLWPQGVELVKAMRASGMTATFMSGDGCFDPSFIKNGGSDVEGTLVTFRPNQDKLPGAKKILKAYRKRFGRPGSYSLYAYTAVDIVLQAIVKAGSTDGVAVAHELHKMSFDTPLGKFKFDDRGDPEKSPYVIWKVENGRYEELPTATPPVSQAPVVKKPAK